MACILYDNPGSSNALKARFGLAEVGLDYETREVAFDFPRPDWYTAINPVGGIPTLDDDGLVLSESNAILRYVAGRQGRLDLYPGDPRERAQIDELIDRWVATFRPALFKYEAPALGFAHGKGMGGAPPQPERLAEAAAELAPTLRLLDHLVEANGGYGVLGRFTIADICAGPILFRTTKTGLDLNAYPSIMRWRETVISRPSFAAANPVV